MDKKIYCDLQYRMAMKGINSIKEMEDRTGVSRIALTRMFNGESQRLDFSTILNVIEVLECNIEDLLLVLDERTHRELQEMVEEQREKNRRGYVYFLQKRSDQLIKIGRTKDIETRVRQLELETKDRLDLVLAIPTDNTVLLEKEMHERFKDNNVMGEWFEITQGELQGVKEHFQTTNRLMLAH